MKERAIKKIFKMIKLSLFALSIFLLSGCEFLQGTLSSAQQEKLKKATGSPVYDYKVWYYNGMSGEDMSQISSGASENYSEQTLCINFGQKVALSAVAPSGKMIVNYTDSDGIASSKTITSLKGHFSLDYTSFYLDMSPVTKLLGGSTFSATVDIKMSGFVCAEGEQDGRPVNAFEFSSLQVRPLYDSISYDYSTVGFSKASKFKIPLKGKISLKDGNYKITGKDLLSNEYKFNVSTDGNNLFLSPDFTEKPANLTNIKLKISNILAEGSGTSYSKDFSLTFMDHLIVIDGLEDSNWTSDSVVAAEDKEGDTAALGADGVIYNTDCDITKFAVANDDDYLYLAIYGSLASSWGDGFGFMISKDHSSDAAYTSGKEKFAIADAVGYGRESLAHGKADFYMYHKPQDGSLGAWVEAVDSGENTAREISTSVQAAKNSSGTFMEYAIPLTELASAGISAGATVYLAGIFSAHWDAGIFAADIIPDSAAATLNESHSSVTFNFQNALKYTIK